MAYGLGGQVSGSGLLGVISVFPPTPFLLRVGYAGRVVLARFVAVRLKMPADLAALPLVAHPAHVQALPLVQHEVVTVATIPFVALVASLLG